VRRRLEEDFKGKKVLHLFGGLATFGTRMDIDPRTCPHVIADAWLPPFARDSFDVVILDPPYIHFNALLKTALFRAAGWIAREHVVWFTNVWASQSGGLKTERAWLVRVGDACHVRCLQYFRVMSKPETPWRGGVKRGPAVKYNRWLAQPQALPLWTVPKDGASQ